MNDFYIALPIALIVISIISFGYQLVSLIHYRLKNTHIRTQIKALIKSNANTSSNNERRAENEWIESLKNNRNIK